ncbi:dihydroorotase [Feifania hominis]|uniref:Dihydroorotase n=1 Tax=Feifania hominis TaxID=2763660 RepID=A0A926DBC2_9FIRM|nr:dihydroorotase [Feifania hominis]MBC8535111.1 dihydroorotase [Feifania hominis]
MRLLIENGRVIDPASGTDQVMDLCLENGVIAELGEGIARNYADDAEIRRIDATGKIVAPGLVDMHCHLREPGFEHKETIETGTRSAAKGGFTSIACMPNTQPVADNKTVISYILNRAAAHGAVHVYPIGAVTKGLAGRELAPIGELKEAGAVAVSDDGRPVSDSNLMKNAMIYAAGFDMVVSSHCEDLPLAEGGQINEGCVADDLGLRGITPAAEEVMIARDIVLAQTTGLPVHIAHVSTRGGVALLRDAKRRGVPVTAETCPHYFSLTEEAVRGFDTNAKMNPPLRTAADVEAVIEGLCDGTLDAIATDHAPHAAGEKQCEFDKAPNGIVGFETALALGITYLVRPGRLSLMELLRKMTVNPAAILRLDRGRLARGAAADLVIFDENREWVVSAAALASKSKNTPYDRKLLAGAVEYTIVDGRVIVDGGELMV